MISSELVIVLVERCLFLIDEILPNACWIARSETIICIFIIFFLTVLGRNESTTKDLYSDDQQRTEGEAQ